MSDSVILQPKLRAIGPYTRHGRAGDRVRLRNVAVPVDGLTRRQYQMLLLLSVHGWCTSRIIESISRFYGFQGERAWTAEVLGILRRGGYVITTKAMNGTRGIVYAVSEAGLRAIQEPTEGLGLSRDVTRDPASLNHFLALNRFFVRLINEFKVTYWLTDFQVRADNIHYGKAGLAKDYDAVSEFIVQGSPVRVGIEYEASLKSAARYRDISQSYASEKYLHLIIYVLSGPVMLKSIAPSFKTLGARICFITEGDFLASGGKATSHFWQNDELHAATLTNLVSAVGKYGRPAYVPFSQLQAANLPAY